MNFFSSFNVWIINTGKIEATVDLEFEAINNIIAIKNTIFLLGFQKNANKELNFVLKAMVENKVDNQLRYCLMMPVNT